MSVHYQREIEQLRKHILSQGAIVEDAIAKAITALLGRDAEAAERVIQGDSEIDRREVEIEEECLKILALYQPVAQDLRFIVAVLKMNNDLERMGDYAVSIAKRARWLSKRDPLPWPPQIEQAAERVQTMVEQSLDALITGNADLGRQICASDTAVDNLKREINGELRGRIAGQAESSDIYLKMMDVPRHLERIADLATNIAEDVIYMAEGIIIRHQQQPD